MRLRVKHQYSSLMVLLLSGILLFPVFASGQDLFEWELRVIVEKANIHLEPGENSTVIITVPQSSILRSYEKKGEWFRVIFIQESGIVVIGYMHSSQVKVMKEKVDRKIDFWGEESGFFKGIGLTVKISFGFNRIAAGEINRGIRGVVDYHKYLLSYWGYELDGDVEPLHSGFDFGADAIYSLTSHIGIGLGVSYIQWENPSYLPLKDTDYHKRLDSKPWVRALPVRLGAFVTLPVFRKISVTFNAGPAYYFVRYKYNMAYQPYTIVQKASGQGLGFHGGIGLEFEWNSRATFFIEYQGRYAKFNNFEGVEFKSGTKEEGPLFYIEDEGMPQITIYDEAPQLYDTVRRADFDLSGFAIRVGAKVKF